MKKTISVVAMATVLTAGSAMASGWRIPEQSVDSTAKAGANVASATRGDTAYFNPANMSWMSQNWHLEADLTYIYLSSITYEDARTPLYNSESEEEHFLLPQAFMVSPDMGGFRFGLSIVEPYGLSKRWESPYAKAVAEEFSLAVIEVNPTVSYNIKDMVSVAGGVRMLYADATVKSDASGLGVPLSRSMEGDTVEWGWNAALSVKPMEQLNISATYRSHVDLEFEDKADLNLMGTLLTLDADVIAIAPAVFALSFAYDIMPSLTAEFTWDRTFWSEYETLDFNFSPAIPGNPFEAPQVRDWDDADAFRLGLTWRATDAWTIMGGFTYDQNPAPEETVSFELPDSDAWIYSLGFQYAVSENMDLGAAVLYDYKESREIMVTPTERVYGEFTDASAFLISVGMNYRF